MKPVTINDLKAMKCDGVPISVLTAYDTLLAGLIDKAGIDMILVGDSLANVFQGKKTTIPVTLDEMIYHGEIVVRSVKRAFVVIDMPFMTYQVSPSEALRNAGRLLKETGCQAVKVEGGVHMHDTIRAIVNAGIPVIGHIGLTPQSIHSFGGFGVRGRDNTESLAEDARAVDDAGASAVVIEKIPRTLAERITAEISIPTIGIGAGSGCDGQVLVTTDILGYTPEFNPKFVRKYANLADIISQALIEYKDDVKAHRFPSTDESYE